MSDNNEESNEVPVEIIDNSNESDENSEKVDVSYDEQNSPVDDIEEIKKSLIEEQKKSKDFEDKLKLSLADFQNLKRKIQSDIDNELNNKFDKFMLDFLQIHDDFTRAKDAFVKNGVDVEGLESILKNMDSLLSKHHVSEIPALGEIFDPKIHEAISITHDPNLDDGTITKELRKGYISHNRVIRPTLVEISKNENN